MAAANSLDAVADRDFAVEFLAAAAILMMHLSRLGEELVLWSTQEFGFMTFSDAYATGSSMMPQKKNPDIAELVRGRAGRVYGDLVALLVVLKGLPLSYNRDLQEDKPPVIDAADTCEACLSILADALSQAQFHADRMAAAAADPALGATDLAEYLVERGVPFREAHHVVGRLVAETDGLKRVDAAALARAHQAFGPDALERLDPRRAVQARSLPGGPAPERVRRRAAQLRELFRAAGG